MIKQTNLKKGSESCRPEDTDLLCYEVELRERKRKNEKKLVFYRNDAKLLLCKELGLESDELELISGPHRINNFSNNNCGCWVFRNKKQKAVPPVTKKVSVKKATVKTTRPASKAKTTVSKKEEK